MVIFNRSNFFFFKHLYWDLQLYLFIHQVNVLCTRKEKGTWNHLRRSYPLVTLLKLFQVSLASIFFSADTLEGYRECFQLKGYGLVGLSESEVFYWRKFIYLMPNLQQMEYWGFYSWFYYWSKRRHQWFWTAIILWGRKEAMF